MRVLHHNTLTPKPEARLTEGLRLVGSGPRNNRKGKLKNRRVKVALDNWLFGEKLTYRIIREKLRAKFGVQVGISTLCKYFQRHRQPVEDNSSSVITIELSIRAQGPVEFRVLGVQGGKKP